MVSAAGWRAGQAERSCPVDGGRAEKEFLCDVAELLTPFDRDISTLCQADVAVFLLLYA